MCRTPDDVKFFGRAKLGDVTAGMTDAEQAAYWKASRDRMAAQNMELGAKLERTRKALVAAVAQLEAYGFDGEASGAYAALSLSRSDI